MLQSIRTAGKSVLAMGASFLSKREYREQKFTRFNERPVEFAFVFRKLSELYPHRVLDVGTGTTALPHLMRNCGGLVSAADNIKDYWPKGMVNRHFHILDDDITDTRLEQRFDLITCVSVLEHIENSSAAVKGMFSLLEPGGSLIITCPFNETSYVRNVYELPNSSYGRGAPYITQSYSRNELNSWLAENDAVVVDQEYWQFWDGEFWTVGNQIIPPVRSGPDKSHQHTCIHLKKREDM